MESGRGLGNGKCLRVKAQTSVPPHHLAARRQRGPTHSFASLLTPAPFAAPRKRCCLQARTFAEHLTRHSVVEGRQIQSIKEREREITAFLLLGSLMESVW